MEINLLYETEVSFKTVILSNQSEISAAQQKLARTEVALNSMTQERNALRDTNARLQAERDILKRDQNTQQMLRLNLQEIKNGLDMSNSAIKMKLENEIENLRKENEVLRRKVSTETERFKEAVFSWESANKELIEKLRNDQDSLQATKEDLENSRATIARLSGEIEDLQAQVKVLSETTLETVNQSEDQPVTIPALERQIKELKTQLRDAKIENETLTQHLTLAKENAEEYRSLCATLESELKVNSDRASQVCDELQQRLQGKDEFIRDMQASLTTAEREVAVLKDEKTALSRELETKTVSLEEEISRMRRDLQSANSKLQSASEENIRIKLDLEKQTLVYRDIQEKYEKQLAAHTADTSSMNELKLELESVRVRVGEEEQSRRSAENQLSQAVSDWLSKETSLRSELGRLKESKDDLETLNSSLQDQIINLTTRMENTNKGTTSNEGGDTEGENDAENQKSSEQWLQLIRYLRREKEIASTKTEMTEATCARYENQVKHLEKQIADLKKEMSELQDSSHVSIITSAKQADLLRKVETLSALTDSNRMLREEKDVAVKELHELREKFAVIEVEIGPLREKASELEARCESLLNENTALKQDVSRWRKRASELLEKSNKVSLDEMKRLQSENDNLIKQLNSIQEANKKQQADIGRNMMQIKTLQSQNTGLANSNQGLINEKKAWLDERCRNGAEISKLQAELQTLRLEVSSLKNTQVEKEDAVEKVNLELENVNKLLEEQKNTVKAVKSIARKYKKQYEDLLASKPEAGGVPAGEAAPGQQDAAMEGGDAALADAQREEIARFEAQVKQLQEENESLKREAETMKTDRIQAEERLKNHLKTLREKLQSISAQKTEAESQLNEYKARLTGMEVSAEESSSRLAGK